MAHAQIKADAEGQAARSYNYRMVMHCGGAELDMRGRCSAGQKACARAMTCVHAVSNPPPATPACCLPPRTSAWLTHSPGPPHLLARCWRASSSASR